MTARNGGCVGFDPFSADGRREYETYDIIPEIKISLSMAGMRCEAKPVMGSLVLCGKGSGGYTMYAVVNKCVNIDSGESGCSIVVYEKRGKERCFHRKAFGSVEEAIGGILKSALKPKK